MYSRWIYDKVNNLVEKYHTRNLEKLLNLLGTKLHYIDSPSKLLGAYRVILRNGIILTANNIGNLKKIVLTHKVGYDQLHGQCCTDGHTFHENRAFNPTNVSKNETNIFAAHLLISGEDLVKTMRKYTNDKTMAYKLGVSTSLLNLKISEMMKLNRFPTDIYYIENPKSTFLEGYGPLDDE